MNYIWELAIRAERQGYSIKDLTFLMAEVYSPYMELSLSELNKTEVPKFVEINPYYRFYAIFKDLFEPDDFEAEELRKTLFDIIIHFLSKIDRLQGMNKTEYYMNFIIADLERGTFGEQIRESFIFFKSSERNIIARNIYRMYKTGQMLHLLKDTVGQVFNRSIIYVNYEVKDELLFFLDYQKTIQNEKKLTLITEIFLPVRFRIEVYWNYHFGVIDNDATMVIDNIVIY